MPTSALLRLAGLPLMVGGIVAAIVVATHLHEITDPIDGPVHLALFFSALLVLLGWPAVLERQAGQMGIVGHLAPCSCAWVCPLTRSHTPRWTSASFPYWRQTQARPFLASDSPASTALMHGPYGC